MSTAYRWTGVAMLRDGLLLTVAVAAFTQLMFPLAIPYYMLVAPLALLTCWVALLQGRIPVLGNASLSLLVLITLNAALVALALLSLQRLETMILADLISAALTVALLAAAVQVGAEGRLQGFLKAFLWCLFIAAAAGALLGFVKLYLFSRGVLIEWILERADRIYPWGTSWRADYNFYSLGLLCGVAAAMYLYGHTRFTGLRCALFAGWLAMACAGVLSGSRRFLILFPLVVSLQLLALWRNHAPGVFLRPMLTLMGLVLLAVLLVPISQMSASLDLALGQLDLAARASSVVDPADPSGLSDRQTQWEQALADINDYAFLSGEGFNYLYFYGEQFALSRHVSYPHNPILSAGLYGGFFAGVSVLAFFAAAFVIGLRLFLRSSAEATIALLLFAGLAYLMVSANTLFSIWSFLVLLGLAAPLYDGRNTAELK